MLPDQWRSGLIFEKVLGKRTLLIKVKMVGPQGNRNQITLCKCQKIRIILTVIVRNEKKDQSGNQGNRTYRER